MSNAIEKPDWRPGLSGAGLLPVPKMTHREKICLTCGRPVDPGRFRGPIRLRLRR